MGFLRYIDHWFGFRIDKLRKERKEGKGLAPSGELHAGKRKKKEGGRKEKISGVLSSSYDLTELGGEGKGKGERGKLYAGIERGKRKRSGGRLSFYAH